METLEHALQTIAGLDAEDFELSRPYWKEREFGKGDYYNEVGNVCKYLGFITDGVFRTYYVDVKSEEEKNVFFFSKHQIVVSFQSFINQAPCNYYTQSMTDSKILYIHVDHLMALYKQSHKWEHFGRLIAEMAFNASMKRTESFLLSRIRKRIIGK